MAGDGVRWHNTMSFMLEHPYSLSMVPTISGVDAVVSWFGGWPSFHDAEITVFHLNRGATSILRLHTWLLSNAVGGDGRYIREREAEVTFELRGITSLRLEGEDADVQNVIAGLRIEAGAGVYRIELAPCYGLAGEIVTKSLAVHVGPVREE
jgi:hypothetical protein